MKMGMPQFGETRRKLSNRRRQQQREFSFLKTTLKVG